MDKIEKNDPIFENLYIISVQLVQIITGLSQSSYLYLKVGSER